jgi:hypothetical protein
MKANSKMCVEDQRAKNGHGFPEEFLEKDLPYQIYN